MPLEIVSRRGGDKRVEETPIAETPVIETPKREYAPHGAQREWISPLAFMTGIMQFPQLGGLIVGRALRIRNDGYPAMSVVLLNSIWDENSPDGDNGRWEDKAVERLNTYLSCGCRGLDSCEFHKVSLQKWLDLDAGRLQKVFETNLPEAVARLKEFEEEHSRTIVKPGGPMKPLPV
jgi:hypothetical protein